MIQPVALFGSECCPGTTKHSKLSRLCRLKYCVVAWYHEAWQHQEWSYKETYQVGVAAVIEKIAISDMDISLHTTIAQNSMAKTILQYDPGGNWSHGHPKKKWLGRIKEDLESKHLTLKKASTERRYTNQEWKVNSNQTSRTWTIPGKTMKKKYAFLHGVKTKKSHDQVWSFNQLSFIKLIWFEKLIWSFTHPQTLFSFRSKYLDIYLEYLSKIFCNL